MKNYDCKICTNKLKDNGHYCMDLCKGDDYETTNNIIKCRCCGNKFIPLKRDLQKVGINHVVCCLCNRKDRDYLINCLRNEVEEVKKERDNYEGAYKCIIKKFEDFQHIDYSKLNFTEREILQGNLQMLRKVLSDNIDFKKQLDLEKQRNRSFENVRQILYKEIKDLRKEKETETFYGKTIEYYLDLDNQLEEQLRINDEFRKSNDEKWEFLNKLGIVGGGEFRRIKFYIEKLQNNLKPFQDEYFKGLSYEAIAELAKKSIRLTKNNTELINSVVNATETTGEWQEKYFKLKGKKS